MYIHTAVHASTSRAKLCIQLWKAFIFPPWKWEVKLSNFERPFYSFCLHVGTKEERIKGDKNKRQKGERKKIRKGIKFEIRTQKFCQLFFQA